MKTLLRLRHKGDGDRGEDLTAALHPAAQGELEQMPGLPPAQASRKQKQHVGENVKVSRKKKDQKNNQNQNTFKLPQQLKWAGLAAKAVSLQLLASTRAMVAHTESTACTCRRTPLFFPNFKQFT